MKSILEKISNGLYWKNAFEWVSKTHVKGVYMVSINDKVTHYIPKENKFVVNIWFDDAHNFGRFDEYKNYAVVKLNGKYNILQRNGDFLLTDWVDFADYSVWAYGKFFISNNNKEYVI